MPLTGEIVSAVAAWQSMISDLELLRDGEVTIVSAYLKESALRQLADHIDSSNQVLILTRWQASDLINRSSDLSAYEFAAARGWSFFARLDLHAKLYQIGHQCIYIGSANLTGSGYGLNGFNGNAEGMVRVTASESNAETVRGFFSRAVRIDSSLYERLYAWVESNSKESIELEIVGNEYPLNNLRLESRFEVITSLMVSECFQSDGRFFADFRDKSKTITDESYSHDLSLLGISKPESLTIIQVSDLFRRTRMFNWLASSLTDAPANERYFGELTATLHDVLLDDPKPYRSSVKVLLSNILGWIQILPETGLMVDRPNFSQRVYLTKYAEQGNC